MVSPSRTETTGLGKLANRGCFRRTVPGDACSPKLPCSICSVSHRSAIVPGSSFFTVNWP
jgi:hypothetical protein